MEDIFEIDWVSTGGSMGEFMIRMLLNFAAVFVIVRLIYYSQYKNKDYLFTFFLFNTINFLICYLLSSTQLKIGFAFGLFAIFSILRYRTVTIPVKEMGYFFVSVTIGVINALIATDYYILHLLIANGVIIALTFFLDKKIPLRHENYKEIVYERIDLIHPDKRQDMLSDLQARTGISIYRVELIRIDFFRDVALIHAFYYSDRNETPTKDLRGDD